MTVREALAARDTAIAEQTAAHPSPLERGLAVIEKWAGTGKPFSSNDYRAELVAADVPSKLGGALVLAAVSRGLIVRLPSAGVMSTDVGTHHKRISEFIGAHVSQPSAPARELVTVPVSRTRSGKFSAPAEPSEPTLFEVPQ